MYDGYIKYDAGVARNYDADRETEPHWDAENSFVQLFFTKNEVDNLLDVPIGTGRFLPFYKGVEKIYGVDVSADMLNMARSRAEQLGYKNIDLTQGDLFGLNYSDKYFDIVVCWRFAHLIPKSMLLPAAKELGRVSSGTVLLQVYVRGSFFSRLIQKFRTMPYRVLGRIGLLDQKPKPWSHIQSYFHSEKDLLEVFQQAELSILEQHFLCKYQGHDLVVYVLQSRQ